MFVRMSYVHGDPGKIDDLITYVRTVVKPATDELAGNHGLGMWVNRSSGEGLVTTVWDDEATLLASEDAVVKLRDDAAGIIGGDAEVERYETVLIDGGEPHQPGQIMRLVRMSSVPSRLDSDIAWAHEAVLPTVRGVKGYLSYVLSVDRATGAVSSSSTFRDQECASAAMTAMAPIREMAATRGIMIDSILDYEVAIVGIRAPMAAVPQQRLVDITESTESLRR